MNFRIDSSFCGFISVNWIPCRFSLAQMTVACCLDPREPDTGNSNKTRTVSLGCRPVCLYLNPPLAEIPSYGLVWFENPPCKLRRSGLEHACGAASIFQHPAVHSAEQDAQLLPIHRLLQKEGCSDGECLLHGLSLIPPGHDHNRRRFIPGGSADHARQIKTMQIGHLQIQKNPIKSFLIHQASRCAGYR